VVTINEPTAYSNWQVKTLSITSLLLLLLIVPPVFSANRIVIGGLHGLDPLDDRPRFPVLLALSGGGVRGLATIGVLEAFEERGIRVAAVAGTSIGGIVGGLYAAGYSPAELKSIASQLDFSNLMQNAPPRSTMLQTRRRDRGRDLLSIRFDGIKPIIPQALTSGQQLTTFLTRLTTRATYHANRDFKTLKIPFVTVSTDVISGEKYVLRSGSLSDAMRATMAFPLAFTGLDIDGRLLMDGGMVDPVPVEDVKELCDTVDFVVAVNTTSPLLSRKDLKTPLDIANQVTTIMAADKRERSLAQADIVVEPVGREITSSDFRFGDSLIALGYQAGLTAADSIAGILSSRIDSSCFTIDQLNLHGPTILFRKEFEQTLLGRRCTRSDLVDDLRHLVLDLNLFRLEGTLLPTGQSDTGEAEFALQLTGFPCFVTADSSIRLIGNQVMDDTALIRVLALTDSLVTPPVLRRALERLKDHYRKKGYDLIRVQEALLDPHEHTITLVLDEAIIRSIEIENIGGRTADWFIRSHFPLKVGQPYSTGRSSEGIANIYGTDLFDRVMVDLIPDRSRVRTRIRVEEKKYNQLRLGWHWDDEYDSEEFLELLDDNVAGAGVEVLLHGRYSPDRQMYSGGIKADRIFKTYLTGRLRMYRSVLDRHLYNDDDSLISEHGERATGFEARLGQQIARLGTVSGALRIEEVDYELDEMHEESFGLRILSLESLVENFDRVPFPTRGKRHYFELQQAGKLVGGDVEYTRFFTSIELYQSLGKYVNYHPKVALGISRSGLPASEKFYLGGMHSFAGYRTDYLSGDKMFLLSNELRFKLPLHFYLSLRYDLGDVYGSADEIKPESLRHGAGGLLSLDTPLGPFEIGYGAADGGFDRFYLRAGFQF